MLRWEPIIGGRRTSVRDGNLNPAGGLYRGSIPESDKKRDGMGCVLLGLRELLGQTRRGAEKNDPEPCRTENTASRSFGYHGSAIKWALRAHTIIGIFHWSGGGGIFLLDPAAPRG